tara:strand:- start:3745 stop:4167 length:423 start_codon:yes stop_codon:yes gene_type:complete
MKKKSQKILIVVSRYNEVITSGLERYTINYLSNHSSFEKYIVEASGAFEIPFIIEKYIKKYDGVIALGCIIRGETNNFELISQSVTDAIINLSIKHKKPIGNGIITCFNGKQAKARMKKGTEAAAAVVNFFNGLKPLKLD